VTPVKDQAACGSCWAFATAATLEGAHAVKTGQLLSFSEQQWVSCVKNQSAYGYISEPEPCCYGCEGGDNDASYHYAMQENVNLVLENDWKYQMANGTCEYESKDHTNIYVQNYIDVPRNNSAALKDAVAMQPVKVSVDASTWK